MSNPREFQGRSLDEAIQEACSYFGVDRAGLEIEIINDAKSGIFGLVGAKKASIKASRVSISQQISGLMEDRGQENVGQAEVPASKKSKPKSGERASSKSGPASLEASNGSEPQDVSSAESPVAERAGSQPSRPANSSSRPKDESSRKVSKQGKTVKEKHPRRSASPAETTDPPAEAEPSGQDMPALDLASVDEGMLLDLVTDTVTHLVVPITGEMSCSASISGSRIKVAIECGDEAGLLLGREGQTLASIQYIASRIIAKKLNGSVRLQFDVGNYRERQDQRLKEMAESLAAKAKESNRPQSTRPLSAYQRRIIHLALENDHEVVTRSKGEGPQRRVIIQPRREAQGQDGDPGSI